MVILTDDAKHVRSVANWLRWAGVAQDKVTEYRETSNKAKLEQFLRSPSGVLVTTEQAFSGMESASIIYLNTEYSASSRSAILRAVEQCVWITAQRSLSVKGFTVDSKFLPCSGHGWGQEYFTCSSCSLTICGPCHQACHAHCHTSLTRGARILRFLPLTPGCGCGSSCSILTTNQHVHVKQP